MSPSPEVEQAAEAVSRNSGSDVFLYNGSVTSSNVLHVMEEIQKRKSRPKLFLLMVTYGGDPHAAYKISRYIQDHYEHFSLFVGGFCKSAGTFFAIAANEVIFAPFGELGPLDVQMAKPDHFQFDSGLVIGESLDTLERRAAELFKRTFQEVLRCTRRPK
jgi:ClpP class serine protease